MFCICDKLIIFIKSTYNLVIIMKIIVTVKEILDMKKLSKILTIGIVMVLALNLTAFSMPKTDTMMGGNQTKGAVAAFQKIIKAFPKNVGFHKALSHWGFTLPSGEKFEWTKDLSANKVDLAMVLMADQFTKAGLDINKLDKNLWIYKPAAVEGGVSLPNRLIMALNVSDKRRFSMGSVDALKVILSQTNSLVQYYKTEGHYMLMLGNGYEIHWTDKLGGMAADMEFVVKAEPLVKAGLNIKKLEASGWKFEAAGTGDSGKNEDQIVKEFKLK